MFVGVRVTVEAGVFDAVGVGVFTGAVIYSMCSKGAPDGELS